MMDAESKRFWAEAAQRILGHEVYVRRTEGQGHLPLRWGQRGAGSSLVRGGVATPADSTMHGGGRRVQDRASPRR